MAEDTHCLKVLRDDGVEIVPAEEIDRDAFRAAAAPVVSREVAKIGPAAMALWNND